MSANIASISAGSSPRVWRHRQHVAGTHTINRFISTRVETSNFKVRDTAATSVHLHACGDIELRYQGYVADFGSSPRVWRHRLQRGPIYASHRFISTRVETSLAEAEAERAEAVHLHACGDITGLPTYEALHDGSSPRVWRHPRGTLWFTATARFISTRVETSSLRCHAGNQL